MHEFESFLHLLQRLSYFDETLPYADEVRDFHSMHHLQSPLVRVENVKSISKGHATKTQAVCGGDVKTGRGTDGQTESGWHSQRVDMKKRKSIQQPALTVMPELAAISTNNDTMKNPLQLSPPGKENIKSMFLFLKAMFWKFTDWKSHLCHIMIITWKFKTECMAFLPLTQCSYP